MTHADEVSLKKDLQAYWASPGAAGIQKKLDDAGVEMFEAEGDLSAEQVRERDSVVNLTENQRKHFSTYAKSNTNHRYWICQMFLPRNITKYEYEEKI